jgi:diphthine-ammonia ligase
MKVGVLFSGGKDSSFAAYLAHKEGYEISCLISVASKNKDSFMFHTPSIKRVKKQAECMGIPLIFVDTLGEKEEELLDLEKGISQAIKDYNIEGIVTGAVESVYQATRVQRICNKLRLECFNPLWQKDQVEILNDLIKFNFEVILVGIAAYPLDESWLGERVDEDFILKMEKLKEKYQINPAGEGGEFETFVLNCPLFNEKLKIKNYQDFGKENSWRREIEL